LAGCEGVGGLTCAAPDKNRNFGSPGSGVWGSDNKTKSLRVKDSDVFQGPRGFSEPETRALRDLTAAQGALGRLSALLDVHCCIGAVLTSPAGGMPPEEQARMRGAAGRVADAVNEAGRGVTKLVAR
jgi:hypothetical protein